MLCNSSALAVPGLGEVERGGGALAFGGVGEGRRSRGRSLWGSWRMGLRRSGGIRDQKAIGG